jgi:Ser/Thr protein kinase RdoA (MazF antagonist)
VAVFHLAVGEEPTYDNDPEAKCFEYGKNVAWLHNALDGFSSPFQRFHLDLDHFIDKPLRMIKPFLKNRSEAWHELCSFAALVRRRIVQLPMEDLEWGFCHGDLQGYHHRIAPDGTSTFIDFDCGGFGFRAYDLAVLRWCARDEHESVWWPPYLAGYQEVRGINALDIEAVPLFVACRYIWHMGVHCENAPDWGCSWLNDQYFDQRIDQLRRVRVDYGIE